MSVLLGHAADAGLMLRAAIRESQWRSGMTWRVPLGWVLGRDVRWVAMRRWRAGGQWRGLARSGLGADRVCRRAFRDASGLLVVGWRAAEVVTELSQAARNMVGRRGMR